MFKFDEKFIKDYHLIIKGKYSKTSKEFKDLFPKTVVIKNVKQKSLQHLIFDKDIALAKYWADFLKDDNIIEKGLELWPVLELKNEILNYEK